MPSLEFRSTSECGEAPQGGRALRRGAEGERGRSEGVRRAARAPWALGKTHLCASDMSDWESAAAFAGAVALVGAAAWARHRRATTRRGVLVVGGGGREHALAWRLARSASLARGEPVYVSPGNGGTAQADGSARGRVENVDLSSADELVAFAVRRNVRLVVVGPEQPLAEGLAGAWRGGGVGERARARRRFPARRAWQTD